MNKTELESMICILANAITDTKAGPGSDDFGGSVGCLTEAVMSIGTGLGRIAESIQELASAVRVELSQAVTERDQE